MRMRCPRACGTTSNEIWRESSTPQLLETGCALLSPAVREAAEWKEWVKVIYPAVLQGRLPGPPYRERVNPVEAIGLATEYSIRADDIPRLRIMMARFVRHYEELYYQHKLVHLPTCRAVFHALLHVPDCVE